MEIKINKKDCFEFNGFIESNGYARIMFKKKREMAHRIAYCLFIGKIQKGREIDHLCKNRKCINPNHLESVFPKENLMRGNGYCAVNNRKTHCVNGHEFSGKNLSMYNGKRICKKCKRDWARKNRVKNETR